MNISKDNINGVKNLPGVNVTSCIVPCTDEDNYPTHDSFYGKGGWREVRTINDRNAIPMERRTLGMAVSVTQENKVYVLRYALNNNCWYELNPTNATDIINDEISRGNINIDLSGYINQGDLDNALENYATESNISDSISDFEQVIHAWVNDNVGNDVSNLSNRIDTIDTELINVNSAIDTIVETCDSMASDNATRFAELNEELVRIEESLGGGEDIEFATKEALDNLTNKQQEDYETLRDNLSVVATTYQSQEDAAETYATKESLSDAVDAIRLSLSGYVNSEQLQTALQNSGFINRQYLRGYATEFYVQDYVACAMAGKVKPGEPLVDYSAEIASLRAQIEELTERLNNLTN